MRLLRMLAILPLVAALGWSGWWYAVALGQEAALARWLEERRAAGWQADYEDIRLSGFPFRVVRRIDALALADPEAGWAWDAPQLVIESDPLDPTRFTIIWPPRQRFAVPAESAAVRSERMEAELAVGTAGRLPLREARAEIMRLRLDGRSGWRGVAGAIRGHVESLGGPAAHSIALDVESLSLPAPIRERLDPLGVGGDEIERLTLEGTALFDRPLDLRVIEEGRLGLERAEIDSLRLEWGELRLAARGRIEADAQGYPVGEIEVSAEHWRELIAVLVRGGVIGAELAQSITTGLGMLAGLDGRPETLDGTLRLAEGRVWFGPVPLAAAPRIAPPR